MDEKQYLSDLKKYINRILISTASKKLIVAGPGTGKTNFFRKAINYYGGGRNNYLALTFINNLVDELHRDLGDLAKVYTFHGYCHYLLRRYSNLRLGLQNNFDYYPPLIKLIKSDWEMINKNEAPKFSNLMRKITIDQAMDFFIDRSNYYNAVGYDDSVFRVYKSFIDGKEVFDKYKLIIVDEYQDFNTLETSVLAHIADHNPILIVGDDDQALYCQLRGSDPKYIRNLFNDGVYENFELPYCLRCPSAVISVFNGVLQKARKKRLLSKRINKRFDFFPPVKEKDSKTYPKTKLVISSIQKKTPLAANYLGRYILQEIIKIPKEEIEESHNKNFSTVLIIGPNYYLTSIIPIFEAEKYEYEYKKEGKELSIDMDYGLALLKKNKKSNLGWRIVLEVTRPGFYSEILISPITKNTDLLSLLPKTYIQDITKKIEAFEPEKSTKQQKKDINQEDLTIKLVTFEGAKGLSAQHVFIMGVQNGNLPRNPLNIQDIEICKFLVAITRTRKQCHILCTTNFAGKYTKPSEFINWIPRENLDFININKNYWDTISKKYKST